MTLPPNIQSLLEKEAKKQSPEVLQALQFYGLLDSKIKKYLDMIITEDPSMKELKLKIMKIWKRQEPVLILGESGTGKELIARSIHGDRHGEFIPINMTALPDYLIESELYGHVKGAFTGASTDKQGLLSAARDGTIFLDEIGDMPLLAQSKILRAMQEMVIRPIGSVVEQPINCRFVCATHRNLEKLITEGLFRLDLYYRISAFTLKTTPLRERISDIDLLLKEKLDPDKKIPDDIINSWKEGETFVGNVRELEHKVLRYTVLGE